MVAEELRILVIGKTGNGKSTVWNILLGRDGFQTGRSMASTTLKAQQASDVWKKIQITVVDTPDPVNWDGSSRPDLVKEIQSWKAMTSPGPSAILLAIRCDVRYTAEEYDVYKRIKAAWGDSSFTQRLVVAFTFGDRQDRPIEQELRDVCPELKSVVRDAKGRYVLFNGQTDKRDGQLAQIQVFVIQMDRMPTVERSWREHVCLWTCGGLVVVVIVYLLRCKCKGKGSSSASTLLAPPTPADPATAADPVALAEVRTRRHGAVYRKVSAL